MATACSCRVARPSRACTTTSTRRSSSPACSRRSRRTLPTCGSRNSRRIMVAGALTGPRTIFSRIAALFTTPIICAPACCEFHIAALARGRALRGFHELAFRKRAMTSHLLVRGIFHAAGPASLIVQRAGARRHRAAPAWRFDSLGQHLPTTFALSLLP